MFDLYQNFASEDSVKEFQTLCDEGISWGEAKEKLYNETLTRFSSNRQLFFELTKNRDKVEDLLLEGASKARKQAQNVLKRVRARVGF